MTYGYDDDDSGEFRSALYPSPLSTRSSLAVPQRQIVGLHHAPIAYGDDATVVARPTRPFRLERFWVAAECAAHYRIIQVVVAGEEHLLSTVPAAMFSVYSGPVHFGGEIGVDQTLEIEIVAVRPRGPSVLRYNPLSWLRFVRYWLRPSSWRTRSATHAPAFYGSAIGATHE